MLVYTSTNLKHDSVRLLLGVAAIFCSRIWTSDFSQAHLQCPNNVTWFVLARPKVSDTVKVDELPKILKLLYGLANSGDYRHSTTAHNVKMDLH